MYYRKPQTIETHYCVIPSTDYFPMYKQIRLRYKLGYFGTLCKKYNKSDTSNDNLFAWVSRMACDIMRDEEELFTEI